MFKNQIYNILALIRKTQMYEPKFTENPAKGGVFKNNLTIRKLKRCSDFFKFLNINFRRLIWYVFYNRIRNFIRKCLIV